MIPIPIPLRPNFVFLGVGLKTLETVIKIDGFELKEVEEIVESVPKLWKVISDKNALVVAEEKAHFDINESQKIGFKNSKCIR